MDQLPTRARVISIRAITMDCTTIAIRCEITDGPRSLIGRTLDLVIPPTRQSCIAALKDLLDARQKELDKRTEERALSML